MDEARAADEVNKYKKFRKVDGAAYRKVNQFLRKRTYITAREWALARLCTDFRTTNGAEMTFIGQNLPQLVPFMEEPYSPQAVNQARNSFKKKVRKSSATFFYGAMCGFFTTEELDDLLFEASEVARFLLEVEGTTLDIDEEIDIEDRITGVMRSVGEAAKTILKTRVMDAQTTGSGAPGEPGSPDGGPAPAGPAPERLPRRRKKKKAAGEQQEPARKEPARREENAGLAETEPAFRQEDSRSLPEPLPPAPAAPEPENNPAKNTAPVDLLEQDGPGRPAGGSTEEGAGAGQP